MSENLSSALSATYLRANIRIGSWSGQIADKEAAAELNASKHAIADASRVVKNLMAGADAELKAVKSAQTAVRSYFYSATLPLSDDEVQRGDRLLAASRSLDILRDIKHLQNTYEAKLNAFISVYDQRRQEAINNLADFADPTLYPTAQDVRDKFYVKLNIDTFGATEDFSRLRSIPVELAEFLAQRKGSEVEQRVQGAIGDLQSRVLAEVERMAGVLTKAGKGEKTKMYASLTTNMEQVVQLLEDAAPLTNGNTKALADRIRADLLQHEVDAYKGNETLSADVGAKAQQIADDLPTFDWM